MENINKNVENSKKQQTECLLSHQSFDYFEKLLLMVNDLTEKRKHLFEQGIRTDITKEMIDNQHTDYFSKIEEKIHVKSNDIINYLDECIKRVPDNPSSNEEISLVFNYCSVSKSKSIFVSIMNDILLMTTCDEGFAKKIVPSSSYFETINSQTGNFSSRTKLIAFFENEKSFLKEMNNLDLLGFLNYIDGFNWRSSKQFNLN